MEPKFHKGQKVTLGVMPNSEVISALIAHGITFARFKIVYTVREIIPNQMAHYSIRLEEIHNPTMLFEVGMMEIAFTERDFVDATTLEDSKNFAEMVLNDIRIIPTKELLQMGNDCDNLYHLHRQQAHREIDAKTFLIRQIFSRMQLLGVLKEEEKVDIFDALITMSVGSLEKLDDVWELKLIRRMPRPRDKRLIGHWEPGCNEFKKQFIVDNVPPVPHKVTYNFKP